MTAEVDICNLALSRLGDEANISSINPPDGSVQSAHCSRFYPLARDTLLNYHAWGFCTRRAHLAEVPNETLEFTYCYALPADFMTVLALRDSTIQGSFPPSIQGNSSVLAAFSTEVLNDGSNVLYCNVFPAEIVYRSRVSDAGRYPPMFVEALSFLLASYLSGPLLKGDVGASAAQKLYQSFMATVSRAIVADCSNKRPMTGYVPSAIVARGGQTASGVTSDIVQTTALPITPTPPPVSFSGIPLGIYSIQFIVNQPFVSGLLARVGWSDLEIAKGAYDFSFIESQIAAVQAVGQKLTLAVFVVDQPAYINTEASATWVNGPYGTQPVPWDSNTQTRWTLFCQAMANHTYGGYRLKDHPALSNIDCPIISSQGIRLLGLPGGYTANLYRDACIQSISSMVDNFPNKNCYTGLFGVNDGTSGPSTAEVIRDAVFAKYNGIAVTRINWYQENMTGKVPEIGSDQGDLVFDVRALTSIMLQACWRWSDQAGGTSCNWEAADTPQKGFDNAVLFGGAVTYVEMYPEDLNTVAYQPTFQAWHDALPFP